MNTISTCKQYEGCNAQLCPMSPDSENQKGIWYPDEDICPKRKEIPNWVKQQRKIAKKVKPESYWHYFTLDMLKVPFRVTVKVKGLDPDKPEGPQLKRWLKENKGVRGKTLSKKQREQKRQSIRLAREARLKKKGGADVVMKNKPVCISKQKQNNQYSSING